MLTDKYINLKFSASNVNISLNPLIRCVSMIGVCGFIDNIALLVSEEFSDKVDVHYTKLFKAFYIGFKNVSDEKMNSVSPTLKWYKEKMKNEYLNLSFRCSTNMMMDVSIFIDVTKAFRRIFADKEDMNSVTGFINDLLKFNEINFLSGITYNPKTSISKFWVDNYVFVADASSELDSNKSIAENFHEYFREKDTIVSGEVEDGLKVGKEETDENQDDVSKEIKVYVKKGFVVNGYTFKSTNLYGGRSVAHPQLCICKYYYPKSIFNGLVTKEDLCWSITRVLDRNTNNSMIYVSNKERD